jgi:pantothenate kinase type III
VRFAAHPTVFVPHWSPSLLASPFSSSRTPLLKEEDLKQEDPIAILSKNLPDEPHDYIFGISRDASSENAAEQSKMRKAPKISVYVVSTNRAKAVLLAEIWKTVPSRFFVMTGDDFFKREEGRYDTMGTDRLATLTGAVHLHGHPALVFDGGTATTYSATDSDGKIMGGGIGPGIQSKFRSLRNDTDALPEISSEEVLARVKEAQEDGKPLPTFARNTQEAMIVDNFQEFALKGRNVIEQWLEKAYKETTPAGGTMVNADRRVLCTGGDGDILMQLLQPHHGGLIEHIRSDGEKSNNKTSSKRYEVESSKHLIHYGIACVLLTQYSRLRKGKKLPSYGEHIGKRVAKYFNVEADDGDNIFRGNVVAVIEVEGEDPDFRIKYDDGDSEDVTIDELAGEF